MSTSRVAGLVVIGVLIGSYAGNLLTEGALARVCASPDRSKIVLLGEPYYCLTKAQLIDLIRAAGAEALRQYQNHAPGGGV